ncbi:MAG: potassium transporter TrkG [Planctomycetota bacterium]
MAKTIARLIVRLRRLTPRRLLVLGYLGYALVGWFLLSQSWTREAADPASSLDALFVTASAVSTTGLSPLAVGNEFSFVGELIILALIQAGGLGYMTLGSFILIAGMHEISRAREGVIRTEFNLPESFKPKRFVRNVVLFTFAIEAIGAAALFPAFLSADVASRAATEDIGASFSGTIHVAWQAIFHSVSAFCTAGFSLFPDSLEQYQGDVWVLGTIACLSMLGAFGFIVMTDVFRSLTHAVYRITLTSKISLTVLTASILGGAALIFLGDPGIQQVEAERRLLIALFQSMTASTTVGFNTYHIGELGMASLFVMLLLMSAGASPAGTGGGLKATTVSALFATAWSVVRGRNEITFFGKCIPAIRLHAAFASLTFYLVLLGVGTYLLLLTERRQDNGDVPFRDIVFEATSAIGTVGLSRGITGDLTDLGKLIIVVLMLAGRIGPMTLGLALLSFAPRPTGSDHHAEEDVAV